MEDLQNPLLDLCHCCRNFAYLPGHLPDLPLQPDHRLHDRLRLYPLSGPTPQRVRREIVLPQDHPLIMSGFFI